MSLRVVQNAVVQAAIHTQQLPVYEGRAQLHPGQLALLKSHVPITIVVAGIRGGKTHGGALKTILYALEHPCAEDEHHLVLSPTYQMSKVPVEKLFKLLYDKAIFPVCPLIRYIRSERTFVLEANGGVTRITVRSLHEPNRLRGMKALSAWIDEGAYVTSEAWEIVQGRLADSAGPCWVTTTPAGYNWVYELYEQARAGDTDIRVIHFTSLQNPFLVKGGFERLAGRLDSKTYAQEVRALFVRDRGLIYYPFKRVVHVQPRKLDPRLPIYVGQDFNVDPMASLIGQPFKTKQGKEGIHWVSERVAYDSDTYLLANYLKTEVCDRYRVPPNRITIYADASGKNRRTSGKSDFYILREAGFQVEAPARNPMVRDRINCVNGLLRPMDGSGARMLFDPSCEQAILSFSKHQYKKDSDPATPDKEHGFDHLTDAGGYAAWKRYPLRAATMIDTTARKAA